MTDAQPWPPGAEPGQPDADLGWVKPDGQELARHWPDGPPGDSWSAPPGGGVDPAPLPPPVASFTYSPPDPHTTDLVTFDGSASAPGYPEAPLTAWNWALGPSATRSGQVVTWRLPSGAGDYNCTLTVTDTNGEKDSTTQVITLAAARMYGGRA